MSQRVCRCYIFFLFISVGASFKPIHDEATNSTSSVTQTTTATEASTVIASHPDPDQPTGNTTANSATVSGSGLTENSSSQQPQNSGSSVPDSSGANHTENTPSVKPTATSAASKAAAFFTSGKMSSSSTEKIKSKSSLVEGSDCEYIPFFARCALLGQTLGSQNAQTLFCDYYCSVTHSI